MILDNSVRNNCYFYNPLRTSKQHYYIIYSFPFFFKESDGRLKYLQPWAAAKYSDLQSGKH